MIVLYIFEFMFIFGWLFVIQKCFVQMGLVRSVG